MTLPPAYDDFAKTQGQNLAELLWAQGLRPDCESRSDGWMLLIMLRIGFWALTFFIQQRIRQATRHAATRGLSIHRHKTIHVTTLLGVLALPSPYLYSRRTRKSSRPLKDLFGWYGGGRTDEVERALTDFGAHDSFAQAKVRFERHYKFPLGESAPRDVMLESAHYV